MREDGFPQRPTLAHFARDHRSTAQASTTIGDSRLIPVWYQLATIDDEGRAEPVRSREGVTERLARIDSYRNSSQL